MGRDAEGCEVKTVKKKRKKAKKSPNALSKELLESRGHRVDIVERTIPHTFIKKDLFGCIDLLYLGDTICGVQATSDDTGGHGYNRRAKILASPAMRQWLVSQGRIFLHVWVERGEPKEWICRESEITLADFATAEPATTP